MEESTLTMVLTNQGSFTNHVLMVVLGAVAGLPGLVLAVVEATRKKRRALAWAGTSAFAGAATFAMVQAAISRAGGAPALVVFGPLALALVAGAIPGLVLLKMAPMSAQRRWPVFVLGAADAGGTRSVISLEEDGLTLGDEQVVSRESLAEVRVSGLSVVLVPKGDGASHLQLLPIPDDGDDERALAHAVASRIRRHFGLK